MWTVSSWVCPSGPVTFKDPLQVPEISAALAARVKTADSNTALSAFMNTPFQSSAVRRGASPRTSLRSSLKVPMNTTRLATLAFLVAAAIPAAAQEDPPALLAKAVSAFENNQKNEKHWNWNINETRRLLNRSGTTIQSSPAVTSESVIRSNGRRCNAVLTWGDGRAPYMKDADPDERCQAFDVIGTPFDVALLLKSANAKVVARSAAAIRIAILPDKSRTKSREYRVRCAASIRAAIDLDPATFFPLRIEGDVTESGCDGEFLPVVHYETVTRQPMVSQFRKGAAFRIAYALQKDKFDNPANSYWISSEQHYTEPWNSDARVLYYWGRQIPVSHSDGHRLVKDVTCAAQEFGAGSSVRFDK